AHRLAAAHVKADAVDHPASAVGLFEFMGGQIAPGRLRAGRLSLWARPIWRGFLGARRRHRPAQRRQVNLLPAAVTRFSSRLGAAAVSKQREDIEHAFALKAPDSPQRPRSNRLLNPLPRVEPCRSGACARHISNRLSRPALPMAAQRGPRYGGAALRTARSSFLRRAAFLRASAFFGAGALLSRAAALI